MQNMCIDFPGNITTCLLCVPSMINVSNYTCTSMHTYTFMLCKDGITARMCMLLAANRLVCHWVNVCIGVILKLISFTYRCICVHACMLLCFECVLLCLHISLVCSLCLIVPTFCVSMFIQLASKWYVSGIVLVVFCFCSVMLIIFMQLHEMIKGSI